MNSGAEKNAHSLDGASNHDRALTDSEREAVRKQLNRILSSFAIRTSKKCSDFLHYVVEETLEGRAETLKERTLGMEVFHRGPLYETNTDPVVRVTAGEVRKRLAQYYSQPSHRREIRIELHRGSYVPTFRPPDGFPKSQSLAGPSSDDNPEPTELHGQARKGALIGLGNRTFGLSLALIVGLLAGAFAVHFRGAGSKPVAQLNALDQFWGPVVNSTGRVWLCIGEVYAKQVTVKPNQTVNPYGSPYMLRTDTKFVHPLVILADSATLARITGYLQSRNKAFTIHGESETNLSDLASGPAVLIGAYDNDWAIRLTGPLRFHFAVDPATRAEWIVDRENPAKRIGMHIPGPSNQDMRTAYAIVSRVRDALTGQMVISVAGVSTYGTRAAGEFVSNPSYFQQFLKHGPPDWASKNLQLLIDAQIVNGSLGKPNVAESYSW